MRTPDYHPNDSFFGIFADSTQYPEHQDTGGRHISSRAKRIGLAIAARILPGSIFADKYHGRTYASDETAGYKGQHRLDESNTGQYRVTGIVSAPQTRDIGKMTMPEVAALDRSRYGKLAPAVIGIPQQAPRESWQPARPTKRFGQMTIPELASLSNRVPSEITPPSAVELPQSTPAGHVGSDTTAAVQAARAASERTAEHQLVSQ